MTLDELVDRFQNLGFVCHREACDGGTRLLMAKLVSTPGNRLSSGRRAWLIDDPNRDPPLEVHGPGPYVRIADGGITFAFYDRIPGPPDPHEKQLATIDELYEELLHYWFDADSPMSTAEGFIPGPGRPPGA